MLRLFLILHVHEDIIIIGAYHDDDTELNSGSAYIYEKDSSGVWVFSAKLTGSDIEAHDWFVFSVSLHDEIALVGASQQSDGGAAYVFVQNETDGSWTQTQKITANDGENSNGFGYSVSVYDEILVVGANSDDYSGTASGAAYVFEQDSTGEWVQIAKLVASDGNDGGTLGVSVELDVDILFVGALSDSEIGVAYVFPTD